MMNIVKGKSTIFSRQMIYEIKHAKQLAVRLYGHVSPLCRAGKMHLSEVYSRTILMNTFRKKT